MSHVNTAALTNLYNNTTPFVVADPALLDAAIQAIVSTVNGNDDALNAFLSNPTFADDSITTAKLKDFVITRAKLSLGSVGVAQLDPTLLTGFGDIAIQAEFNKRAVNVQTYGATGDGTTNDTLSIQAALNAVTNGTIYFPAGEYLISKQTTRILDWAALQQAYGLLLLNKTDVTIMFAPGAKLLCNVEDANTFNAIWIEDCENVKVINPTFTGVGTTTSKIEHDGVGVLVTTSKNVLIERAYSENMRGCARAYDSDECVINNGFSTIYANEHSTGHFALYSCTNSSIVNCSSYGSTLDGEIFIFGGGSKNCTIEKCRSYAYVFGDTTKTIINGQGIMIDSGGVECKIVDCYGYGFYYAFGIKNSSEGCTIDRCIAEKCKIGIYVGKGEGTSRCNVVTITDNKIIPNGGNGDITSFLGSITIPVGIAVLDSYGGTNISGNSIYNSVLNQANHDFMGMVVALSDATAANAQGTFSISGNNFILQNRNGDYYGTSRTQAINITTAFEMFNIEIIGNTFQLPDVGMTTNLINVYHGYGVSISDNSFSSAGVAGPALIRIDNSQRVMIDNNNFSYHAGLLEVYASAGISFNGNMLGDSIGGVGRAVLKYDACTKINIFDNTMILETVSHLDDIFFLLQNGSDILSVHDNVLEIFNKNYTNWYASSATTATVANNIINGVSTNQPPYIAPTLLNSWGNFDSTTEDIAGYYKDDSGIVHIKGMLKNGTVGTAVFTLPVGYRPLKTKRFAILSNGVFASVAVDSTGGVNIDAGASNLWISLANISFKAEQ